jgi:hypothetical protein
MAGRFEAAIGYVEEVAVALRDGSDEVPFGLVLQPVRPVIRR